MGPKTLPTIWGTYMKLVTKYQKSFYLTTCEFSIYYKIIIWFFTRFKLYENYTQFVLSVALAPSFVNKMNCELMLTYDTPALRQTCSTNLTGQKTLPMIWGTYIKLVTKYLGSVFGPVRFLLPVCRLDFYTHWTYILYMPIFSRIFLSSYWWQKSDIWSQAHMIDSSGLKSTFTRQIGIH
jgi:hypothetical protein